MSSRVDIPFEHVVIAAETREIHAPEDLLKLAVYGIPESLENRPIPSLGLELSNGRRWLHSVQKHHIGSHRTVWNLAGRVDDINPLEADHMISLLSFHQGVDHFEYTRQFNLDPTLTSPFNSNCLGFVCSVFGYMGYEVLSARFPKYRSPYKGVYAGDRDYPSPGHLGRAFRLGIRNPQAAYCAADVAEAEKYAPASQTLREALASGAA